MSCNDKLSHKHHPCILGESSVLRWSHSEYGCKMHPYPSQSSLKSAEMSLDNGQLASSKVE